MATYSVADHDSDFSVNIRVKNASWVSMHIAHKQIESPVAQDSKIFQFPS